MLREQDSEQARKNGQYEIGIAGKADATSP
jgi:hypothetical protein